jgi:23S rRNA pseudouridine1911/1915/1917 synthase
VSRRKKRRRKGPAQPVIRYLDEQIVVVDKPAGLTTVRNPKEAAEFGARAQRFLPPTLGDKLPVLIRDAETKRRGDAAKQKRRSPRRGASASPRLPKVFAIHRLDKETSGLVVFARTPAAARHLGGQFRGHSIERVYLAIVRGHAKPGKIESHLVRDRGDGRRGSVTLTPSPLPSRERGEAVGERAVTHVSVVEDLGDYTLVECRLETGRTHQVRIHLGEAGTPLCGEHIYDRPLHGKPLPDGSGAGRPMLHAAELGLDHPVTGARMLWKSKLPPDMQALLFSMRKRNG